MPDFALHQLAQRDGVSLLFLLLFCILQQRPLPLLVSLKQTNSSAFQIWRSGSMSAPSQNPAVVPVAKPAEVSAQAKSRDEAPQANELKKQAATTPQGGAAAPASKASALGGKGGGKGMNTMSPASGGTAAAAPKAKSAPAPPTSAAAIVEEGKKPMTAAARISATGSSLAKGVGAKAEPQAKPKAKAKMAAMSSRPLPRDTMGAAPTSVLNIVSGQPVPATQAGTSAYATSTVGPARTYAKSAAGAVNGEVPKAGPPAVAMGRALAAGRPAMQMVNGKPVTTITKKYQLVFVTGEVAPFSKTGGLGEAMDGLPIALGCPGSSLHGHFAPLRSVLGSLGHWLLGLCDHGWQAGVCPLFPHLQAEGGLCFCGSPNLLGACQWFDRL